MKEISVIIPSYNRPKTLKKVIDTYIVQKNVREIIVIDDGSNISYIELNDYIVGKIEFLDMKYKYIKNTNNMGAAYCRNLGVKNAEFDYIFWGEDDAFLSENYLEILISKINEKEILCGAIIYDISLENELNKQEVVISSQRFSSKEIFNYKLMEGYFRRNVKDKIEVPFGHALILVPKKAYEKIHYFEGYDYNGYREESDAQVQMVMNGYKIYYVGEAVCYHLLRNEVEENSGQHKGNWLKYEYYKFINNLIFFRRYKKYFKTEYRKKSKIVASNLLFSIVILKIIVKKIAKSILVR